MVDLPAEKPSRRRLRSLIDRLIVATGLLSLLFGFVYLRGSSILQGDWAGSSDEARNLLDGMVGLSATVVPHFVSGFVTLVVARFAWYVFDARKDAVDRWRRQHPGRRR